MAIDARRSAARTSAPIRRLSCSSGNSKKIRRSFNQELVATGSPDSAREPGRRGLTRSRWGSSPSARRWRPRRPGRSWPVDPTPAALGHVSIDAAIESCTGVRRDEFGSRMDLGQLKPAAARGPL